MNEKTQAGDFSIFKQLDKAYAQFESIMRTKMSDAEVQQEWRKQLVQAVAKLYSLARQIQAESDGPSVHAVIIGITPEIIAAVDESKTPELGTKVKIERSRHDDHQDLIGQTGYVLSESDPHGDVMVALESGDIGFFNVGFENREREFSFAPEQSKRLILSIDGRVVDVLHPDDDTYQPGDVVRVEPMTNAILGKVTENMQGTVASVKRIMQGGRVFVKYGDSLRVISAGRFYDQLTIGRLVLVDRACNAVIEDLGDPESDFHLQKPTGVDWVDIGGLEEAKEQLRDMINLPSTDPELFAFYRGEVPKGVLLIGPPGGGKGMLAKAFATELGRAHGETIPRGYLSINGPEILKGIVGEAEELIRDIVAEANRLYDELGYSVLFIDEIDAIGKKRGTGVSTDVFDTIVPALLTELNNFKGTFIAATNRVDILDPALIRSGRIDLKIVVPRPNQDAATKIFRVHLRGIPLYEVDVDGISLHAVNLMWNDEHAYARIDLAKRTDDEAERSMLFCLGHITSGAMIEALVNTAKLIAMKRDLASDKKTGVTVDDMTEAIKREYLQNVPLDHTDAVKEFVQDLGEPVTGIKKLHQGRR